MIQVKTQIIKLSTACFLGNRNKMLRSAKYNQQQKIDNYLRELLMLYVPCINEYCIIENLGIFKEQYNSLNEMVETWMEKSELAEGLLKVAQI